MTDADARFDEAGNWVGSSYVHAPARQFARFGELYLRDGCVGAERVLPPGTVDDARTSSPATPRPASTTAATGGCGPTSPARSPPTATRASTSLVLPEHDAVLVHLGKTDATVRDRLVARLRARRSPRSDRRAIAADRCRCRPSARWIAPGSGRRRALAR